MNVICLIHQFIYNFEGRFYIYLRLFQVLEYYFRRLNMSKKLFEQFRSWNNDSVQNPIVDCEFKCDDGSVYCHRSVILANSEKLSKIHETTKGIYPKMVIVLRGYNKEIVFKFVSMAYGEKYVGNVDPNFQKLRDFFK